MQQIESVVERGQDKFQLLLFLPTLVGTFLRPVPSPECTLGIQRGERRRSWDGFPLLKISPSVKELPLS